MGKNVEQLARSRGVGTLPTFGEFATPIGLAALAGSFVAGVYPVYSATGNLSLSALGGMAVSLAVWGAERYHRYGADNGGFHPLTDVPVVHDKVKRVGGMDARLTGIYREVFKDESIAVELMDAHPRFIVHVIHHDDVHLDQNKRLRTLARRLGIETETGKEPPFQIVFSWGNGASAIVMPKIIPQDEDPVIIPFDLQQVERGKLVSFLGVDIRGNAIRNNRKIAPHLQVTGTTGSGKTILIRNEMFSNWLAFPNAIGYAIDYKAGIKSAPHTKFTADMVEGVAMLREFLELAAQNWKTVSDAGFDNWFEYEAAHPGKLPPLFLTIDEYPQLKDKGDQWLLEQFEADKAAAKQVGDAMPVKPKLVNDMMGEVVRVYRAGGAFVTIGGQKFPANIYPTAFTDMFDARAAMRVVNDDASRQAIDVNGAESLPDRGGVMFRLASNPIQIGAAAFMTSAQRKEIMESH